MKTKEQREKIRKMRLKIGALLDKLNHRYGKQVRNWPMSDPDWIEIEKTRDALEKYQFQLALAKMPEAPKEKHNLQSLKLIKSREKQSDKDRVVEELREGKSLFYIAKSTKVTRLEIIDIAKEYDIQIAPEFEYYLEPQAPYLVRVYFNAANSVTYLFGSARNATRTQIQKMVSQRGYKWVQARTPWRKVPVGSYFSTSSSDYIRVKKSENFNDSDVIK